MTSFVVANTVEGLPAKKDSGESRKCAQPQRSMSNNGASVPQGLFRMTIAAT